MTNPESGEAEPGEELLTFLISIFVTLRDRWTTSMADTATSPDAPWSTLLDRDLPDDEPLTPGEQLMDFAQVAAVVAGRSVGHHLGLLARAYWLEPADPEGPLARRWLFNAPYAPARAIVEGTALMRWILDPTPDREERVRRAAVLALWSDTDEWEPIVRAAGLTVDREQRADGSDGPPFVRVDQASRPLSQTKLVGSGLGRRGSSAYARWSRLVHHDPRATLPRSSHRVAGGGRFIGSLMREDEHLEMAAEVARFVGMAAERQGAYFGRDVAAVTAEVETARRLIIENLPEVQAQLQALQTEPSDEG